MSGMPQYKNSDARTISDERGEAASKMDEAKKQVQEIAVRAIEGASGSKTPAHVNEIAMEQAKHRGPTIVA